MYSLSQTRTTQTFIQVFDEQACQTDLPMDMLQAPSDVIEHYQSEMQHMQAVHSDEIADKWDTIGKLNG